jgi:hypothetical protein
MSRKQGPASPLKKIRLKVTLEGDAHSMTRAGKALKGSVLREGRLVSDWQTSDPAEAILQMRQLGDAVRSAPKDFK